MKLVIRELVKEFVSFEQPEKRFRAVDTVDLSVEEGELVTLLGPSGCGKTTLLRMIAGFEDPTSGDVLFGEKRVNNLAPNRRNATMVFQSYAIFPHLNLYENIAFGLRLKELPEAQIREKMERSLDLVGLSGLEERQPSQLSGGQQQRVALARAIIMEPELLLFDEPLSNLDAKLREQMRIEIRALQQRLGITSIYVTHDQTEAMSISDRIVVMNHGRIEQQGNPRELYSRPRNRFVADFIGKANFLPGRITGPKQVLVAGQPLVVPELEDKPYGKDIVLSIRPESLGVSPATGQTPEGSITGTLIRTTFLGNLVEYEVTVDGLPNLIAHSPNPLEGDILRPGSKVNLALPPSALHPLTD